MSAVSAFIHKQQTRWYGRGIDRSHQLRRRLAYYIAVHGFEIGDHSVGNPTIRLYDRSRLKIGNYSSVAAGATFILGGIHRTDTVTTSVLDVNRGRGLDAQGDIVIGSDVWIAGNATIVSGVTVGDGAVVGAGSVVIDDIAPYAIAFGNPARVHRKRFAPDIIEALLELRWWDLDVGEVQSLRPLLLSRDIDRFIAECRKVKVLRHSADDVAVEGRLPDGAPDISRARHLAPRLAPEPPSSEWSYRRIGVHGEPDPRQAFAGPSADGATRAQIVALIRSELPTFSSNDLDTPFEQLGIDSMGMITLRAELEHYLRLAIDDQSWTSVDTPADVVRIVSEDESRSVDGASDSPCTERRVHQLNMPQMSLGGLSESWLFKEVGDLHWSIIARALDTPSRDLKDGQGNRLYATFTRFRLRSSVAVAAYTENETITIDAQTSRYGGGMFFTDAMLRGHGRSARMQVMSSFSTLGDGAANASLRKSQPEIPPDCAIPALAHLPDFATEHRDRRAAGVAEPIFECQYEIIPCHDINGVGLLYFAAYPTITDICGMRHAGRSLHADFSTRERDVFYFANSEPDDPLIYRIHRWHADQDRIESEESLSRKSDNVMIAYIVTIKDRRRAWPTDRAQRSLQDRSGLGIHHDRTRQADPVSG